MSKRAKISNLPDPLIESCNLLHLPPEIIDHILSFTYIQDWHSMRLVCQQCRDLVDQSRLWPSACLTPRTMAKGKSQKWQLLRNRRVAILDITEIDSCQSNVQIVLESVPSIRELRINAKTLYFLGYLQCHGLMEHIRSLRITDSDMFRETTWCPIVTPTLNTISNLTIVDYQGDLSSLLQRLTQLHSLTSLDLEIANYPDQNVTVKCSEFANFLYSLPGLLELRIHRITFGSKDFGSPFDPKTCSSKLGISRDRNLILERLDLHFALRKNRRKFICKKDLRYMPSLKSLKFCLSQRFAHLIGDIMRKWNKVDEVVDKKCPLKALLIEFGPGMCLVKNYKWLEKIPESVTSLCLAGILNTVIYKISSRGSPAAERITELMFSPRLFDCILNTIATTFINLRKLTVDRLCSKVKPETILKLGDLPHFNRLVFSTPIPDDLLRNVRQSMTRKFLITFEKSPMCPPAWLEYDPTGNE